MDEVLHRLSTLFQALANGMRLQILEKLQEGEASVSTIASELDRSVKNVSHHLRILRDNNLVLSRTEGQNRMYWLKRPGLVQACLELANFLERGQST